MRYLHYCIFCVPASLHLVPLRSPFSSPHLAIDCVSIGLVLEVATLRPLYHHPSPLALIGIWLVFRYQAPFLLVTLAHLQHFSYRSWIPLRWSEGDRRIGLGLGFLTPQVCFLESMTRTTSGISTCHTPHPAGPGHLPKHSPESCACSLLAAHVSAYWTVGGWCVGGIESTIGMGEYPVLGLALQLTMSVSLAWLRTHFWCIKCPSQNVIHKTSCTWKCSRMGRL